MKRVREKLKIREYYTEDEIVLGGVLYDYSSWASSSGGAGMSEREVHIHDCVSALTPAAPKIVTYHNGTLVAFRNGDGDRVAIVLEHTLTPDQIKHQINRMFKVKAENQPSQDTLEKLKT